MRCLFDASAIFEAIKQNKADILIGHQTIELARYELGNILWKNSALQAKIPDEETKTFAKITKQALSLMEIAPISCSEEEILETAKQLKITFYDASYVHTAKAEALTLITQDKHLKTKAQNHIDVRTLATLQPK